MYADRTQRILVAVFSLSVFFMFGYSAGEYITKDINPQYEFTLSICDGDIEKAHLNCEHWLATLEEEVAIHKCAFEYKSETKGCLKRLKAVLKQPLVRKERAR